MKRTWILTAVAALSAVAWGDAPKLGQGRGQVTLSWDEFVQITGYDPARKGGQVVTVPWKDVESMLGVKVERVGKATTVDLPWRDFKALLEWSVKRQEPKAKPAPVATSKGWGRVNCVVEAAGGALVGTTRGLFVCDAAGRLKAYLNAAGGLGADSIGAIVADPDRGRIWLGTLGAGMTRVSAAAIRDLINRTTRRPDRTRGSGR